MCVYDADENAEGNALVLLSLPQKETDYKVTF